MNDYIILFKVVSIIFFIIYVIFKILYFICNEDTKKSNDFDYLGYFNKDKNEEEK